MKIKKKNNKRLVDGYRYFYEFNFISFDVLFFYLVVCSCLFGSVDKFC